MNGNTTKRDIMETNQEERNMALTFMAQEMVVQMTQQALTRVVKGRMNARISAEASRCFVQGASRAEVQLIRHEITRLLNAIIDNAENIVDKY
jgi:hypothetical protein